MLGPLTIDGGGTVISGVMVSFHGGSSQTSINNVGVFAGPSEPASPFYALGPNAATQGFGALPALRELRGLVIHPSDGTLLVVNAYNEFSQILQFSPTSVSTSFAFTSIYASDHLDHPFDAVFAFNGDLYVSNQDAKPNEPPEITIYSGSGATAEVFPVTTKFVALRGLAFDGTYLYVADAGGKDQPGTLYAFSQSGGEPVIALPVSGPVHLLYDGTRYLYIGSESANTVLYWDTQDTHDPPNGAAPVSLIDAGLDHTGGMALVVPQDALTGTMYVASRVGGAVRQYSIGVQGPPSWNHEVGTFVENLTDMPEFLLVSS